MNMHCFIGFDIGTSSVRCGLFSSDGELLSTAVVPITTWNTTAGHYEQSSREIWESCCTAAQKVMHTAAGVTASMVRGIGFDATCSLVVLGTHDVQLPVNCDGVADRNVILWMDHRAAEQTNRINRSSSDVLSYVGGTMSPEMQLPKLLWLKEHAPETWASATHFLDLSDYLTYKATGSCNRSMCTVTCKWGYTHAKAWDISFLQDIGLADLASDNCARIGSTILPLGGAVGNGLTQGAADELGLCVNTPVGVGIIDAHAGGLGMIAADMGVSVSDVDTLKSLEQNISLTKLALICGTSSCHMVVSKEPIFVPGVWGPYFGAMVPGLWLNEGGQSATGSLIDFTIRSHSAYDELKSAADARNLTVYFYLNMHLENLRTSKRLRYLALCTDSIHVCPCHHGNRSPFADPTMTGTVVGLTLSNTIDDLALLYLATIQAIAYGTRHIIDTLNKSGYAIDTILACGGDSKNELFIREHCDITKCNIVLPKESDAVLLGSAIVGAAASGVFDSVESSMRAMSHAGRKVAPNSDPFLGQFHESKYRVFLKLHDDQLEYRRMMQPMI